LFIGICHHQEVKALVDKNAGNLIQMKSQKVAVKTEALLAALAGLATPAKAIDPRIGKVDQDKINLNNMEDILQEDNHKRYLHAQNYLSLILIQK